MHLSILDAGVALATLASLLPTVAASSLTLFLPANSNPHSLQPNTHATLSSVGVKYSAPISSSNTFVFHNVTPGSYLADIHCPSQAFQPLRVDIDLSREDGDARGVKAWETFRGNDWENKGEAIGVREGSQGRGVEVRALGGKNYFMERPAFSILSILKNPMILMGIVSMGLMFGMPYLMENMDPELRAEFEEHQKKSPMNSVMGGQGAAENPLGNFDMAAFLAGSNKKDNGNGGAASKGQGVRR